MHVRKIGVVGAGAMGAGIAALAASAGIPVVLLDIPGDTDRGAPAREGLGRALKSKPAAFMDNGRVSLITTGNTADDLELLASCDWIIEAIIEQALPKQRLYERIEPLRKPNAIVSSNTSGIPMSVLLAGRSPEFRANFCGAHFFNPPRYMHLLELIPTPETHPEALAAVRDFGERVLGKGIVIARDVPGFVANRLGIYGMVQAMRLMEEFGLTIDEVDALTGPLIGHASSATFRTGDLTGIDVLNHVAQGLTGTTGEDFTLPPWVQTLVTEKRFGDKTGAGFYRKQGKVIETLDWKTNTYAPQNKPQSPELGALMQLPLAERLKGVRDLPGAHGEFLRKLLLLTSHYAAQLTPTLAYDIAAADHGMEWGYAWEMGPFRTMDALGLDWVRGELQKMKLDVPPLLAQAGSAFYSDDSSGSEQVLALAGGREPVPGVAGALTVAMLRRTPGRVLEETESAALIDMGDGVALFEFRSKMNSIGEGVIRALGTAQERIERDGMAGMVIGNDDPRTFTVGADLKLVSALAETGDWKALDAMVAGFQKATTSLQQLPFPTVVAPFGLTLGGGCEFALHASRVQAHAELYMGLVEVGVGLIPGGGGTKELLFRFGAELAKYEDADPFEGVKRAFKLIAMATTSTSALDARNMGLLRDADRITMNRDRLLADAKLRVLDLASDYVAPVPRTMRALGREAIGNLEYALWSFREAGQASEHDVRVGRHVAYILCGGDGPSRDVTEQDILDLERETFLQLLGTPETRARITAMLKTGKPLRN